MIVIGAGASGMTAALVAANESASVLVLESTSQVGGTSARSSGTLWIPRDTSAVATYLDALVGDKADRALRQAFLAANDIAIAGIEFIVDENGRSFTYDVNTNTNYNPDAEAKNGRAGTSASGMGAIASYLGSLLARETRAGVRQAAPVPA